MRHHFKTLAILALMVTVFSSGIFCCCLTNIAQAETIEELPPCHQAAHTDETAPSTDECECDAALAILEKNLIKIGALLPPLVVFDDDRVLAEVQVAQLIPNYHSPPDLNHSIPLYIKHSVLRI